MNHSLPPGIPPIPEVTYTVEQVRRMGSFAGVYLAFDEDGRCHYVGESMDVTKRVSNKRPELAGRRISFIECRPHERKRIECFYIGLLDPPGNSQSTARSMPPLPDPIDFDRSVLSLAAEWLPVFKSYWKSAELCFDRLRVATIDFEESIEEVFLKPDIVCHGRDIEWVGGDRVIVSVVPWADVGRLDRMSLSKIRAATIAGYSQPSLILIGRPRKYFGLYITDRHKGCPEGRLCDELLHPDIHQWAACWYPDEERELLDPREVYNTRQEAWRLAVREWQADGSITGHVYREAWGAAYV